MRFFKIYFSRFVRFFKILNSKFVHFFKILKLSVAENSSETEWISLSFLSQNTAEWNPTKIVWMVTRQCSKMFNLLIVIHANHIPGIPTPLYKVSCKLQICFSKVLISYMK